MIFRLQNKRTNILRPNYGYHAARYISTLLVLLIAGLQPAISTAQMGMGMGMGMIASDAGKADLFVGGEPPDMRFVGAPEIGEQISDVTIVDDRGNPVNIRELASQSPYTVLTLGCLT